MPGASYIDKFVEEKRLREAARDPYVYPEYQPDPHLQVLEEIRDCLRDIRAVLYRFEDRVLVDPRVAVIHPRP
jgi:hypothetical protein